MSDNAMFYEPGKTSHNLPHDPFKSCVVPRPIGWISTLSSSGVCNLAPFSQFQNLSFDPPHVMLSASEKTSGARKDTIVNIEQTGEFVWNMATYDLRHAVNASAQEVPSEVDEFELAGVTKRPARIVRAPLVAESPIHFECVHVETVRLARGRAGSSGLTDLIIARVVAIHIDDDALTDDGRIDVLKIRPLARLGYYDYTSIDQTFEMKVPGDNVLLMAGLEGNQAAF
jgi:flavin reductase (DIM6/NTAB) family NADH-FMN oxidoreductase RutF